MARPLPRSRPTAKARVNRFKRAAKDFAIRGAKAGALGAVAALAEQAASAIGAELAQKLGSSKSGRTAIESATESTNTGSVIIAASVENTMRNMKLANNSDDRITHKTNYVTGMPMNSYVKNLLKTNGSGYRVMTNSQIETKGFAGRNTLTQGSGFNLTQYHFPGSRANLTTGFIKQLCMQNNITDPLTNFGTNYSYSAVISLKQQFMIKNQSPSLPMEFTIYVVKIKDTDFVQNPNRSLTKMATRFFSTQAIDINGRIPKQYLAQDGISEGAAGEETYSIQALSGVTSLNQSSNFRQAIDIVDEFTKVLAPGDFWNFSHTHKCGSGIDLKVLSRSSLATVAGNDPTSDIGLNISDDLPFTYGFIFKSKGKMAEAYNVPALNQVTTHLGTSNTSYMYEYKSSAYFAKDEIDGAEVKEPAIYQFQSQDNLRGATTQNLVKPFFALPGNIADSQLNPAGFPFADLRTTYVPMSTSVASQTRQYEGQTPG